MNRSESREAAFKLLYSIQILKDANIEEQTQLFVEDQEIKDNDAKKYISDVIEGITKNNDEIEKIISDNIKEGWTISRILKVDLTLLKLGIYEILFSKLPYKVVINEVVELSKKYGDDASKSFINGVLASVIKKNNID